MKGKKHTFQFSIHIQCIFKSNYFVCIKFNIIPNFQVKVAINDASVLSPTTTICTLEKCWSITSQRKSEIIIACQKNAFIWRIRWNFWKIQEQRNTLAVFKWVFEFTFTRWFIQWRRISRYENIKSLVSCDTSLSH